MEYTPMQRRAKILALLEQDPEYQAMKAEFDPAKKRFERFVDRLPQRLRNLLNAYPTIGYFMYHRLLTVVCEQMRFKEER